MNVLMLYPKYPEETFWNATSSARLFENRKADLPPLGLLTIASYLPSEFSIRLIDRNVEEESEGDWEWADVVFLSLMGVQQEDYRTCVKKARSCAVPIAVGGPFSHAFPEVAADDADWVCYGEAESIMEQFVNDLLADRRGKKYDGGNQTDLEDVRVPRYELLPDINAYSVMAVQFSRGCPFKCEFCDIIEIYGRVPRTKTPDQIIRELQYLKNLKFNGIIFLVDDNFIGNKKKAKEMLKDLAIWNRKQVRSYRLLTEASLNLADDAELLSAMADANLSMVFIGIETPDPRLLKLTQKMQNVPGRPLDKLKTIREHGIHILGGFIVGFDEEERDIFEVQKEFVQSSGIGVAMLGLLVAIPHTQLSRRLKKEGRLLDNADSINQTVAGLNFIPKGVITKREYLKRYAQLIGEIYEPKLFFERIRRVVLQLKRRPSSLGAYLAVYSESWKFVRQIYYMGIRERGLRLRYWSGLFHVIFRNPLAIEAFAIDCYYYYHLRRHSTFVRKQFKEYLANPSENDVLDRVVEGRVPAQVQQAV